MWAFHLGKRYLWNTALAIEAASFFAFFMQKRYSGRARPKGERPDKTADKMEQTVLLKKLF